MLRLPIFTDRTRIERLGMEHAEAFAAYRRVPEVARYQSWTTDFSLDDARRLVDEQPVGAPEPGEWLQCAVVDAANGALLGDVAVHALPDQPRCFELGVTIAPVSQRRGIAREALAAMIDELTDPDGGAAHRLIAVCDARNTAVGRTFAALGFRREAHHVEADWFKDEWTSIDIHAILASEWRAALR